MAATDADSDMALRKCPYCPLRYYTAGQMRLHLKQTHSDEVHQLSESQAQSLGIRVCTGCRIWCIDRLFDKDAQYKGKSSWSQHQCRIPSSLSPPQSPSYSPPDVPPAASSISTNESSAVDDEKLADENSTNSENSPDSADNSNVDSELETLHFEYDGIVHNDLVDTNLLPESVESLANHGPIDRNVSLPNRAAWINFVKTRMHSYLAATDKANKLAPEHIKSALFLRTLQRNNARHLFCKAPKKQFTQTPMSRLPSFHQIFACRDFTGSADAERARAFTRVLIDLGYRQQ